MTGQFLMNHVNTIVIKKIAVSSSYIVQREKFQLMIKNNNYRAYFINLK